MLTAISIDNKHRAVVLEVEGIDPADFEAAVMGVLTCAVRLGADTPINIQEDSAINAADPEPECETESEG